MGTAKLKIATAVVIVAGVLGLGAGLKPQQDLSLLITRTGGQTDTVPVTCRIDTPIEIEYYQHGGILPYVLRQLVGSGQGARAA